MASQTPASPSSDILPPSSELAKLLFEHGFSSNTEAINKGEALRWAVVFGHDELVTQLISQGANVDSPHEMTGENSLHYAAQLGNCHILDIIIAAGATFTLACKRGLTAIHYAAVNQHIDAVKLLVSNGCSVESPGGEGCSPLHLTASEGHCEVIRVLKDMGADVESRDAGGSTPLHYACRDDRIDAVKMLIDMGVDITSKNNAGRTPLHIASMGPNPRAVRHLLESGVNVQEQDNAGDTALHLAVAFNILSVFDILLHQKVDLEKTNDLGCTVLVVAAQQGHTEMARLLVKNGADLNAVDSDGNSLLHHAAGHGKEEVVTFLLQNGADIEIRNSAGFTPLLFAAARGSGSTVRFLAERGANIMASVDDFTAIHYAAENGYKVLVRRLVEWGFDIELKTLQGQTALSLAVEQGQGSIVSMLIDCGADLETTALKDWRPLHFAAHGGHADVVEILLENGADLGAKDIEGKCPLDLAKDMEHDSIASLLEAKLATTDVSSKVQSVALMVAAAGKGNTKQVQQLLDAGANIDSMDLNGRRAISLAAETGNASVVEFLIERKANLRLTDRNGESALWWASRYGHVEVVQQFLSQKVDIDAPDGDGQSPLSIASRKGHADVVDLLLQAGSDPNLSVVYGKTALLFAIAGGHLKVVELLLKFGADVNYKSPDGRTALSLAEDNRDDKILPLIRDHTARANLSLEQKYANDLLEAAENGRVARLRRLIRIGTHVDGIEGERIPLHQAAFAGYIDCVRALIDHGADVNRTDMRGQTALGYAAAFGHTPIVQLLSDKGSSVDHRDNDKQTPLGCASRDGHEKTVHLLLSLSAKIEAKDSQGKTPLCYAIRGGHKAIVELLLEKGADMNSIDHSGDIPLFEAIYAKNLEVTRLLLDRVSGMITKLTNGRSALCVAAATGAESIVELLVDRGEDVNYPDDKKQTPIHLAAARGHEMVVNILIGAGADTNLKDDNGRTAWSYAKEYDHEKVIAVLSKAGTIRQKNERAVRGRETEALNGKALYKYEPLSGETCIRLIELHPGMPGDIISFELTEVDLNKSRSFEALSYEHKDNVGTVPVQCNDGRMLITPNCKAAMERLRNEFETRHLWIDSICIDQESVDEFNHHAALMMVIYMCADAVLLWLGEQQDEGMKMAFSHLPAMAEIHNKLNEEAGDSSSDLFASREDEREKAAAMMKYNGVADSFSQLYFRSCFTRAWVFQEIIMAGSRGMVMCGPYKTPWRTFKQGLLAYSDYARAYDPCFTHIACVDDTFAAGGSVSLLDAIAAMIPFQVSDRRDKMSAIMLLASIRGTPFKKPMPDYRATTQDVFVNGTRHCIDALTGAGLWSWLCRPANKEIPGLPTWVPDFALHEEVISQSPYDEPTKHFDQMIQGLPSTTMTSLHINGCVMDKVAFRLTMADDMGIQDVIRAVAKALDKQNRGMYDPYAMSNEVMPDDATAKEKDNTERVKDNTEKVKAKGKRFKKSGVKKGHRKSLSSKPRLREYPQSTNGHAMLKTILNSYEDVSEKENLHFASFLAWDLSKADGTPSSSKQAPEYLERPVQFWEDQSNERDDFDVSICQKMESRLFYGRDLVLTEKGYFGLTERDGAEEGMVVALIGGSAGLSLLREEGDGMDTWYTFSAHFFMSHLTEGIEKLEQIDQNAKIERLEIR